MQPAKKIKLDWPALIKAYPNSGHIFRADEEAQYEAFKCMQQTQELKNQASQILLREMIDPIAGMEQYLLNDPTPTLTSCKLLFTKCTLHKRDALIQMLTKHQENYENARIIAQAFDFPIAKLCEKLMHVLSAILHRFPIFISCACNICELAVNTNNIEVPKYLKLWMPLVSNNDGTFLSWMKYVAKLIEKRLIENTFESDMEELMIIVANRACLGSHAAMEKFVNLLRSNWQRLITKQNVVGPSIRALFYCYEDEQKYMYLPGAANITTSGFKQQHQAELESLDMLQNLTSDTMYNDHLKQLLKHALCTKHSANLFGRALCVLQEEPSGFELQCIIDTAQKLQSIPLALKIGLCTLQWHSDSHLYWLHAKVVEWLQEHNDSTISLLYM